MSRNGADTWALDLDLISVFAESKIVPNGVLPYVLEVLTDPDLLVESIDPALIRTRPFPGAATSYKIELENRDVGILVLSTLFGIAVTLLFETMLVLSVRQSLAGNSTSGEG